MFFLTCLLFEVLFSFSSVTVLLTKAFKNTWLKCLLEYQEITFFPYLFNKISIKITFFPFINLLTKRRHSLSLFYGHPRLWKGLINLVFFVGLFLLFVHSLVYPSVLNKISDFFISFFLIFCLRLKSQKKSTTTTTKKKKKKMLTGFQKVPTNQEVPKVSFLDFWQKYIPFMPSCFSWIWKYCFCNFLQIPALCEKSGQGLF